MNIWSILIVLSAATCLGGGGIAILEYLRKQGNATRQKRAILALLAAFVLLLVGFARSYFEVQVSRRAMERFEKVVANFEVSVKGNAPGIAEYRDRLQSGDQPCLQRAPDGTIRTEDPSCQPQSTEEPVASDALSANVLFLDFFKKPAVDCGEPPNAPADLTMELPVSIRDHTLRLVYDRRQDVFLLKGRLELLASQWKSPTGTIAAPTDLLGSEMVASLHGLGFQAEARDVYRSMELRYLDMNLAGTHSYELPLGPKLQRLRREDGYPAYSYCFPSAGL